MSESFIIKEKGKDNTTTTFTPQSGRLCPFLHKKCIENKCQLWEEIKTPEYNYSDCAICMIYFKLLNS